MKTLVVYFSRGGRTAKVAANLKALTGADVFEIKTDVKYGGYFSALGVARKEFDEGTFPAYDGDVEGWASYDTVILGFPIWYGKCPQVVMGFIKGHDFAGKTVYPFCTSGMSQPAEAAKAVAAAMPGADLREARRLTAKTSEADLTAWLGL